MSFVPCPRDNWLCAFYLLERFLTHAPLAATTHPPSLSLSSRLSPKQGILFTAVVLCMDDDLLVPPPDSPIGKPSKAFPQACNVLKHSARVKEICSFRRKTGLGVRFVVGMLAKTRSLHTEPWCNEAQGIFHTSGCFNA